LLELGELLVGEAERALLVGELGAQLLPLPAAAQAAPAERALGLGQPRAGAVAARFERAPLLFEQAQAGERLAVEARALELGARLVAGAAGERALVEREPFDAGFFERLRQPRE